MSFKDYSEWFVKCINCAYCTDFILGKQNGFLCNDNIDKNRIDKDPECPIRPQAGYIDKEWFEDENVIRILLLGQNPWGGYKEDPDLYKIYEEVLNAQNQESTLQERMYQEKGIKEQIRKGYNPVRSILNDKVFNNKFAFAYANQILCRTSPEAGEIYKRIITFSNVYENCFQRNIKSLISILKPKYIISLGTTWKKYFDKQFAIYESISLIVPHPRSWENPKNREKARGEIEKFILKIRMEK